MEIFELFIKLSVIYAESQLENVFLSCHVKSPLFAYRVWIWMLLEQEPTKLYQIFRSLGPDVCCFLLMASTFWTT